MDAPTAAAVITDEETGSRSFLTSNGSFAKRRHRDRRIRQQQRVAIGGLRTTRSAARFAAAPGRLSTITCWPIDSESFRAIARGQIGRSTCGEAHDRWIGRAG
jgi:hypothetical protein